MELVLVLMAMCLAAVLLILPVVALVLAMLASGNVRQLSRDLERLSAEVAALRGQAAAGEPVPPSPAAAGATAAAVMPRAASEAATVAEPLPVAAAAFAAGEGGTELAAATEPSLPAAAAPAPDTVEPPRMAAALAEPAAGEVAGSATAAPPPPPPPPPPVLPLTAAAGATPPAEAPAPRSLEERIGLTWLTRAGVVLVVIGLAFFFKEAVDNEWLGPWGRVGVGLLAGVAFLVWGELQARAGKSHPVFVQGVLGLGLSLLLVSTYACFGFYRLIGVVPAFAVVALLAVLGGTLAMLHRAESILVLSLVAVFLNPVLLSTGVDRPLALFSYLLLMTSGALLVSARCRFRVAGWVALAGTTMLFAGWYERFFDVTPPGGAGGIDLPPEQLQGAYFPLAARWAPLLFALLFPLQWLLAGLHARRRRAGSQPTTGLLLLLAAAVAIHAATAALLHDHTLLLGYVLCALGAAFALLLIREGEAGWLGLPLLTSFVVLVSLTGSFPETRLLPMMLLGIGWSAIYFALMLRGTLRGGRIVSGWMLVLVAAAGVGLGVLGLLWLLPEHLAMFGLLLTLLAGVYLLLGLAGRSPATFAGAFLLSLGGLSITGLHTEGTDSGFLLVAGLWTVLHLALLCYDLFWRNAPQSKGRMAVLTGVGLGWVALLLLGTDADAGTLRALLALAAGVVYLAIGLRMRRAEASVVLLPLGLALALFTLSIGLLFTGVTVTVLWAAQGAVLAYLAALGRQRPWAAAACALFVLAAGRLLLFDISWLHEQQLLFWSTQGLQGALRPTPFLHPRAWAVAGLGIALLLGARFAGGVRSDRFFGGAALVMLVGGHACLLALLVGEGRLAFFPAETVRGLPEEEMLMLRERWETALLSRQGLLGMVVTVVLGGYAAALLGIGFAARSRAHRLLGIGLFGITLAKLCFRDIWSLERVYQIGVLVTLGLLLLAGGFLYARFGRRILRQLLRSDGEAGSEVGGGVAGPEVGGGPGGGVAVGGLALLVWAALLLAPAAAQAIPVGRYAQERAIDGIDFAGDFAVVIDPELYAASQTWPPLQDLRIAGPDGAEVPFLLRSVQVPAPPLQRSVAVLDPVLLPDGGSRALLDLGQPGPAHAMVLLEIAGEDFLRRTRVESSDDGARFGLLAEGSYVFSVLAGGARSRHASIRYPPSLARFLRVTLLPGADGQRLPIRAARVQLAEPPARESGEGEVRLTLQGPLRQELIAQSTGTLEVLRPGQARGGPAAEAEEGRAAEQPTGFSRVQLAPLPTHLPLHRLLLAVDTSAFVRRVVVGASTHEQAWVEVGGGVVYRVPQEIPGLPAGVDEQLEIPIRPEDRPHLRLRFDDGDDPPLQLTGAIGRYPLQELVLRARAAGEHTLFVGRRRDRPARYDLEEILQRSTSPPPAGQARFGLLRPNPRHGEGAGTGARAQPWSERHARLIQGAIIGLVVVLALWTVLLLLRARGRGAAAGGGG